MRLWGFSGVIWDGAGGDMISADIQLFKNMGTAAHPTHPHKPAEDSSPLSNEMEEGGNKRYVTLASFNQLALAVPASNTCI